MVSYNLMRIYRIFINQSPHKNEEDTTDLLDDTLEVLGIKKDLFVGLE